jgi:hypothetical protein
VRALDDGADRQSALSIESFELMLRLSTLFQTCWDLSKAQGFEARPVSGQMFFVDGSDIIMGHDPS